MRKLSYTILIILIFHYSHAWADPADDITEWTDKMTFNGESATNANPIQATMTGCVGSTPISFNVMGTEVVGDVINIYAFVSKSDFGFAVWGCYEEDIELGPFASGNYSINYYLYTGFEYLAEQLFPVPLALGSFQLQESHNITIEKVSDNEPPVGAIAISGEAVEGQVVTASHNISDANGMGNVTYQWSRYGQPIPDAVGETYLLTNEDVHQDVRVTATYVDGLGNTERVVSLPVGAPQGIFNINDKPIGSVYIRGAATVGSTLTIDTSGLHDPDGIGEFEYHWKQSLPTNSRAIDIGSDLSFNDAYHNPYFSSHTLAIGADRVDRMITAAVSYTDSHGTQEYVEAANAVGLIAPATWPSVTAPADLAIPAIGHLTHVDVGKATAHDGPEDEIDIFLTEVISNGINMPIPDDGLVYFQSGNHLLTWSLAGTHVGQGTQLVRVDPIITFGADHSSNNEGPFSCPLLMSGAAARYPVLVPYSLYGVVEADRSEQLLFEGTLQIEGNEQQSEVKIPNSLVADTIDYEGLLLVMNRPTNAALGNKTTCRITLREENTPPRVSLTAYQNEVALRSIAKTGGAVSVISSVEDSDIDDTHTYDWNESDEALFDTDSEDDTLTFDPASLTPGLYRVSVSISDGSSTHRADLSLRVVDEHPVLSAVDSDGDGETDLDEGSGDQDGDGIPDYLDHADLPSHILPQKQVIASQYLVETEPGLVLALGDIALFTQRHGAMITKDNIFEYSNRELGGTTDSDNYTYVGGIFDFRINGILEVGSSAKVVIPQQQAVAPNSLYRKLAPTGWQEFVVDDQNQIKSAKGLEGYCPSPGGSEYIEGLTEEVWCVELTIQDGGPNDADGQANGVIKATGGAAYGPTDSGDDNGGGGSFSLWVFTMLIVLFIYQRGRPLRFGDTSEA